MVVCGCHLSVEDTATLIGRLDDDHTVVSDEAAAALRFAVAAGLPADKLDRDVRDAIVHVLYEPLPPGLGALRDAIDSGCC